MAGLLESWQKKAIWDCRKQRYKAKAIKNALSMICVGQLGFTAITEDRLMTAIRQPSGATCVSVLSWLRASAGSDGEWMKKKISMFLAIVLTCSSGAGWATSPANRSIETLFKNAKAVVTGKVTGVRAERGQSEEVCNSNYVISLEVKTVRELKSTDESSAKYKSLCSNVPLEVGAAYTLFLEAPTEFNAQGSGVCDLVVDVDGVFQKIGSFVYRVGSPDAKIIVNFEGAKYLTNAVVEPDFDQAMKSLAHHSSP